MPFIGFFFLSRAIKQQFTKPESTVLLHYVAKKTFAISGNW